MREQIEKPVLLVALPTESEIETADGLVLVRMPRGYVDSMTGKFVGYADIRLPAIVLKMGYA